MGKKQVELLAPAKNFMAIKASGPYADAIYFGVQAFNMRMNADNFALEEMSRIADMCHNPKNPSFRRRKAYLTTNILVYEEELEELEVTIQAAKDAGIDAVIVHDFAAIRFAKKIRIPSTQCNISNSEAAKFYESLGAERVILARECSLKQIETIAQKMTTSEVETFIHGAMCSSISGRCYLSQTMGGSADRSANRGRCTQPCRGKWTLIAPNNDEMIFDGQRIFNSRDLCTINYVPDIIDAGVKSLKIEGRMRHPHYVETVTKTYRKAIDAYYKGDFKEKVKKSGWVTELKKVYNRGFTTGFFFNQATLKDSQLNAPANISHYRYIKIAEVETFFNKSKIALVSLINGTLRAGEHVLVMSTDDEHDTYFHQTITDIQIKKKSVDKTPSASPTHKIKISLKMDEEVYPKKIDAIYKFTDKTYGNIGKKGKKRAYLLD